MSWLQKGRISSQMLCATDAAIRFLPYCFEEHCKPFHLHRLISPIVRGHPQPLLRRLHLRLYNFKAPWEASSLHESQGVSALPLFPQPHAHCPSFWSLQSCLLGATHLIKRLYKGSGAQSGLASQERNKAPAGQSHIGGAELKSSCLGWPSNSLSCQLCAFGQGA